MQPGPAAIRATPARLRALGCEVHRFEWIQNFSAARNFAFSKCTGDYIAYLDTDETIENPAILKRFIQETDANLVFLLLDYYCGSIVYWKDRVIARGTHVFRGPMHEELRPIRKRFPAFLDGPKIVHDWFRHDSLGKEDRLARNLAVSRRAHAACPTLMNVHDIANTLLGMSAEHHPEAIRMLWRTFAIHTRPDIRQNALRNICVLAVQQGDLRMLGLASRKMIDFAPSIRPATSSGPSGIICTGAFGDAVRLSEAGFLKDYLPGGTPEPYEEYSLNPARVYIDSLDRIGQSLEASRIAEETLKTYPADPWLVAAYGRMKGDLLHALGQPVLSAEPAACPAGA